MASKDHSFDIVSQTDPQEVTNAVEQAKKEIAQRYDFKDSKSRIDWNKTEESLTLLTESDLRLRSVIDILQTKLVKRGVSIKALEYQSPEKASGGSLRQVIKIRQGIPTEKAREIIEAIKETKIKAQARIQENQVRVQAPKIDDLQELIQRLRRMEFGLDLEYINYR